MKRVIRHLLSFLILLVGNKIKAQKAIDLHFSKIVWANYIADMPKNMHSNKLTIDFYAEINSSGIMIFLEIDADNGKEKYFSYKLTEMQLQALDRYMPFRRPTIFFALSLLYQ